MKLEQGQKLTITMKPALLREWEFVRETKKCLVMNKTRGGRYPHRGEVYVPKKDILEVRPVG